MHSQLLRAWKLGLTPSHRVPSPKSHEVNPCNLNCWEHGSWDLPLHTRSQVLSSRLQWGQFMQSQLVESMEVGITIQEVISTCAWPIYFAACIAYSIWICLPLHMGPQVLSPKSHEVNPCKLNCWEHGSWGLPLHTGSQVPSPNYDMDAYMATLFRREAWDLCCKLGQAKS